MKPYLVCRLRNAQTAGAWVRPRAYCGPSCLPDPLHLVEYSVDRAPSCAPYHQPLLHLPAMPGPAQHRYIVKASIGRRVQAPSHTMLCTVAAGPECGLVIHWLLHHDDAFAVISEAARSRPGLVLPRPFHSIRRGMPKLSGRPFPEPELIVPSVKNSSVEQRSR